MERKMDATYSIEAFINENGLISIKQEDTMDTEDSIVVVHPSQVDTLVQWLTELKDELATGAK